MTAQPAAPAPAGGLPLGRILRRFAPYLRAQRPLLAGSMLALLAATALRLLEPWPLALVIDHVIGDGAPGAAGRFEAWLARLDAPTLLLLCAAGVVGVAALAAGARYLATLGFALAGNRVLGAVRIDLYAHLQRLSLAFHHRARSGDLTLRLTSDVGMLKEATVSALLPLVTNVLVMAGMFGVMLWLDWQLTLLALLPMPLLWLLTTRRGRRIYEASRRQRKREGAMAASAAESMAAIRTVQSLSLERAMAASFGGAEGQSARQDLEGKRLSAGLERGVDLLVAVGTALVLWQGARQVLAGVLSPGDLLVFLSYLKSSFRPVREYAKYTGRLSKALAAGERITDLLDRDPEVRDRPGAPPAPAFAGAIRFERVVFDYGAPGEPRRSVLDGLDLDVRAGERVAIVGRSGAGKSTLASLLLRLYEPRAGAVLIDGHDLRDHTLASVRRQIALVPQDTLLFAGSVRENIVLGLLPPPGDDRIEAAARLAQAHDFISALPQGYDTPLVERGATLSGGQRQRIAIARAAVRQAPIVVLDEPTAGLDRAHARRVDDALLRLLEGRTGLIVTHDLDLAARADRIVLIDHGRVAESGTHAELLARGGAYAAWWRLRGEPEDRNAITDERITPHAA